ncbi:MAG: helix-turn-helix transcriptional regulator [Alphaproteobacteria bacterium]|jgi:transcriptional regulator with XRE-family HTH domain|nr:helix-turn-helix transcriptional regulator [Alphaproteobacteria bacterium]
MNTRPRGPRAHLDAAIARRLMPNSELTMRALAKASGYSEATIRRARNGETGHIDAEMLFALSEVFARRGDHDFLVEIFGITVATPAMNGGDLCYWITEDGAVNAAPFGHARFVRDALRLGPDEAFDAIAYGIRAMGWIEITIRANGRLTVRRHLVNAAADAGRRAADWLAEQGRTFSEIEILSLQGDSWSRRRYDTIRAAAQSLAVPVGDAISDHISVHIATKRLSFNHIADPVQIAALRHWNGPDTEVDSLMRAITAAGGSANYSLLRKEDDGYTLLTLGAANRLRHDLAGRSLRLLRDQHYVDLVEQQFDTLPSEGVRFDDLDIQARTDRGGYRRLALSASGPGGDRYAVTVTDIYRKPQQAVIQ